MKAEPDLRYRAASTLATIENYREYAHPVIEGKTFLDKKEEEEREDDDEYPSGLQLTAMLNSMPRRTPFPDRVREY